MWSLGHVLLGVCLAIVIPKLWPIICVLEFWELVENADTVPLPWGDPTFFNSLVDLGIGTTAAAVTLVAKVYLRRLVPADVWAAVDD